jgi:hypothetical protein
VVCFTGGAELRAEEANEELSGTGSARGDPPIPDDVAAFFHAAWVKYGKMLHLKLFGEST